MLGEVRRILRPAGQLVAPRPTLKYAPDDYWDFDDHRPPQSSLSCAEALLLAILEVVELMDPFLPFTMCSPIPKHPLLVRLYLAFPPVWRGVGRQPLILGRKR